MSDKINGREKEVFVPRSINRSQFKRLLAQLIATTGFGMMVLSVGSLITISTILVGALHDPDQESMADRHATPSTVKSIDDGTSAHPAENWLNESYYIKDRFKTDWPNVTTNFTFPLNETIDIINIENIQLTKAQASWLGSLIFIVQPVGSIVSGFIQGYLGRRNGMMATSVVQFIGWIALYFCTDVTSIFAVAVLMGLSIGFMEAPGLSFLGEVIEPRFRGSFANLSMNMWLFGVLFEYILGAAMTWRYVCLASAAIPTVNFILLSMIPESPVFLLLRGKERQAEKSLRWLRGWTDHDGVRDEYETLVESLNLPRKHSGTYLTPNAQHGWKKPKQNGKSQLAMLCEKRVSFPLFLLALLFFTQHCVSLAGAKPFLINIFQSLNMQMSPHLVLVCSGVLQLIGILICACAIRYTGKRIMILISGLSSSLICILLAIYLYIEPDIPVIPMVLFFINFLANGLGIMSLPWCLIAEVFPTECRGSAAGIAAASSYILGFLVIITYKPLESAISLRGCLLIYACIGLIGTLFTYFKLPETEGKTLEEIQALFSKQTVDIKQPKGHYY